MGSSDNSNSNTWLIVAICIALVIVGSALWKYFYSANSALRRPPACGMSMKLSGVAKLPPRQNRDRSLYRLAGKRDEIR
jgi:hypothetical protein